MAETYCLTDTIYALSSGPGTGGVAVIRLSGTQVRSALDRLAGLTDPQPRYAYMRPIRNGGRLLDRGLVLFFPGPNSFTGEDVAEFQIHGGPAVVRSVLDALGSISGCRPAERGEFSRRAVINGKMDLTEAEGLLDLIHAQTDRQQAQALSQMQGGLKDLYDGWRRELTHHMAYLEAFIDFPEEDIPPEKAESLDSDIRALINKIQGHLDDGHAGERLRDGFSIVLLGAPNVGKSSLMNALTHRDVAIVSQTAGTTRDVVVAHLDVGGFPVILSDTAGLRERADSLESEGIRRAVRTAEEADLILSVQDARLAPTAEPVPDTLRNKEILTVWNKADLVTDRPAGLCLSALTGEGVADLWNRIRQILEKRFEIHADRLITRDRYRVALQDCVYHLTRSLTASALELKAEDLRLAARSLGRITGRIDVEDLLDVIFRDFCIGK